MKIENDIKMKPGKQSTEFIGKVIIQLVIAVNMLLSILKLPALSISPEESLAAAGAIEALWLAFRQWNKRLELTSQTAITATDKAIELESIKSFSRIREMQTKHRLRMEEIKTINEVEKESKDEVEIK